MKITRDVITDLLPLYESGDASGDTRALVDDFLRSDPEFAALVKAARPAPDAKVAAQPAASPSSAVEFEALRRTRRALRLRGWLFGFAIFFTLLPFSFGDLGNQTFFMLRDVPQSKYSLVVAATLWLAYARQSWKLKPSGM